MILWIFLVCFLIGLAIAILCFKAEYNEIGILIIGMSFFVAIMINIVISAYDMDKTSNNVYGVPLCPEDNISYYEMSSSFSNETAIAKEFSTKGWTNITYFHRTYGGFFGGQSSYVSGHCNLG